MPEVKTPLDLVGKEPGVVYDFRVEGRIYADSYGSQVAAFRNNPMFGPIRVTKGWRFGLFPNDVNSGGGPASGYITAVSEFDGETNRIADGWGAKRLDELALIRLDGLADDYGTRQHYADIFGGGQFSPDTYGLFDIKAGDGGTDILITDGDNVERSSTSRDNILLDVRNRIKPDDLRANNTLDIPFSIDLSVTSNEFDLDQIVLEPGWEMHLGNTRTREVISLSYEDGVLKSSHPTTFTYNEEGNPFQTQITNKVGTTSIPSYTDLNATRVKAVIKDAPINKGDRYRLTIRRRPQRLGSVAGVDIYNTGQMRFQVKSR